MIKKLFIIMTFITGTILTAGAQEDTENQFVYLIKGNQVVGKYSVEDVDYVSFHLPEGVTENPVTLTIDDAGKNYITYTVNTLNPSTKYAHCTVAEHTVDYLLQEYCGTTLAEATPDDMKSALYYSMSFYGFEAAGTDTYTIRDGYDDGYGTIIEVIAGQRYIACVWELDDNYDVIGDPYYQTVNTLPAGDSQSVLDVEYAGLDDTGSATFNFNIGSDIVRVRTLYGLKDMMSWYIQRFGYDYTMIVFGQSYLPEELGEGSAGWPVIDEDDYIIYALGIDSEGNWVKAECEAHIVPPAREEQGPQIKIFSKEKGDGKVSVNFEITPSNVDEAYIRLMSENDADDRLNEGYTLAEIASGGDAVDITGEINKWGEYTYTNNEVPRGWESLLIMGRNSDGTTVTRINFHAFQEGSEWDIDENINVVSKVRTYTAAPSKSVAQGVEAPVIHAAGKSPERPRTDKALTLRKLR